MHLGLEWRLELDHSLFWWPRVEHGSRMISSKMRRPEVCPSAWRLWEGPLSEASEVQSTQHVMTVSSALLPGGLWFSSFYASIHSDQLVRKGPRLCQHWDVKQPFHFKLQGRPEPLPMRKGGRLWSWYGCAYPVSCFPAIIPCIQANAIFKDFISEAPMLPHAQISSRWNSWTKPSNK